MTEKKIEILVVSLAVLAIALAGLNFYSVYAYRKAQRQISEAQLKLNVELANYNNAFKANLAATMEEIAKKLDEHEKNDEAMAHVTAHELVDLKTLSISNREAIIQGIELNRGILKANKDEKH